ncbi:MAG TPA: hypothetical protein VK786_05255 [bacterium]|nr:hypothetical protein [bacterium]
MKLPIKKWMRTIWTLTAIVVLGSVSVLWWFGAHKAEWQKEGDEAIAEGVADGRTRNCEQCVLLAIKRLPPDAGLMEEVRVQMYLKGCLYAAKGTLPYCQDAPSETDIPKSTAWRLKTYEALGLPAGENAAESPIVISIQEHCLQVAMEAPAPAKQP